MRSPALHYSTLLLFLAGTSAAQGQFTSVINLPGDPVPSSIGEGQLLNLAEGGVLPMSFVAAANSHLNMTGGRIETGFRGSQASINISGGTIGTDFVASNGSEVNVSGGVFERATFSHGTHVDATTATFNSVYVQEGSSAEFQEATVGALYVSEASSTTVSGGRTGPLHAWGSSDITIESGFIDGWVTAYGSGTINVSGGLFTRTLEARAGGTFRIVGEDFKIDGVPVSGLENEGDIRPIDLTREALTGVLADGTPIVVSGGNGYSFAPGTLYLERRTAPDVTPDDLDLPGDPTPSYIRGGQRLTLWPGGSVGQHFRSGDGATIVIDGGTIGRDSQASGTNITLRSGAIGPSFYTYAGTHVELSGGTIGDNSTLYSSHLEMRGGSLGQLFHLRQGSTATIRGGQIGDWFTVNSGSITIYGGEFGNYFAVGFPLSSGPRGTEGEPTAVGGTTSPDAVADIHGGRFGQPASVGANAHANIYGGDFSNGFTLLGTTDIHGGTFGPVSLRDAASLTLHGTRFALNGQDIVSLEPDTPYLLETRNTILTALLADGSPFDFDLRTSSTPGMDSVHWNAQIYLVLVQVPEPTTLTLTLLPLAALAVHRFRRTAQNFR